MMSTDIKTLLGFEPGDGEEITEETLAELSDGKGGDDDE
jgi:hypothetical protein